MDGWLKLKLAPIREAMQKVLSKNIEPDVRFDLLVSPYDVPRAVRGAKQPDGTFLVEFQYVDGEEKGREVEIDPYVTITEGRYSNRVLAIRVAVDRLGAGSLGVVIKAKVESALDKAALQRPKEEVAYTGAKEAFEGREHDLLAAF